MHALFLLEKLLADTAHLLMTDGADLKKGFVVSPAYWVMGGLGDVLRKAQAELDDCPFVVPTPFPKYRMDERGIFHPKT